MAVHIRLSRGGTKKRPFYRLLVADQRAPNGGRFLENIGTFNPRLAADQAKGSDSVKDAAIQLTLNKARWDYWTALGAQPSPTVLHLIKSWEKSQTAAAPAAAPKA